MQIRLLVRASLWLLLPLAVLASLEAIMVGLFFAAPVLFVVNRPFAIATWFGLLILPLAIFFTLFLTRTQRVGYTSDGSYRTVTSDRLYIPASLIWAFVFFMLFVGWWNPSARGGPWGW